LEGLAIGLQEHPRSVWVLLFGVGAHKLLIAFCIGMEMFTSSKGTLRTACIYLTTFAVMSPIGIAIGLGVTEEISNNPGVQASVIGILQGFAGGTLIYVTFFELLNEQSEKVKSMPPIYSFLEWLCFTLGFVTMLVTDSAFGDHTAPSPAQIALSVALGNTTDLTS
jgi:zinc transporter 1/2/3